MVNVRAASQTDATAILGIYAPYVERTAISFETDVPTVEAFAERIDARYPWLVAEVDGRVAGYAYAGPHRTRSAYRWCAEVSTYVDETYHRRGVARLLYSELFDELRAAGFVNAYAGIVLPNEASVGLHESLGFEPIGIYRRIGFKMGRWHDVGWWGLRLQEPDPALVSLLRRE